MQPISPPGKQVATLPGAVTAAQKTAALLILLFLFLLGVQGLGEGFRLLGRDLLDAFFASAYPNDVIIDLRSHLGPAEYYKMGVMLVSMAKRWLESRPPGDPRSLGGARHGASA